MTQDYAMALFWYIYMFVVVMSFYKMVACVYLQLRVQLRKLKYTEIAADAGETCTICIEDLDEGQEVLRLECGHAFHPKCIAPWIEMVPKCPNCKASVV